MLIRKTVCQGGAKIRDVRLELPWRQNHSAVFKTMQGQASFVQPLCDLRAKHCRAPGLHQREHLILYQYTQPAPTSDTCLVPAEAMSSLFWYVTYKISYFCFLTTSSQLIPSVPILKSSLPLFSLVLLLVLSLPPTKQPHLYLVCPGFYAKGLNHHLNQI